MGIGDGFVKAVLDTKAGSSLADQPAYQRAIGHGRIEQRRPGLRRPDGLRTGLEALAAGTPI